VVRNTPHLRDIIGPLRELDEASGGEIRSKRYSALGCDLLDLTRLENLLAREFDTSSSLVLCTAEVSVTYMNVEAADALIQWAAHFNDSMLNSRLLSSWTDSTLTSTPLPPRTVFTSRSRTSVCPENDPAF